MRAFSGIAAAATATGKRVNVVDGMEMSGARSERREGQRDCEEMQKQEEKEREALGEGESGEGVAGAKSAVTEEEESTERRNERKEGRWEGRRQGGRQREKRTPRGRADRGKRASGKRSRGECKERAPVERERRAVLLSFRPLARQTALRLMQKSRALFAPLVQLYIYGLIPLAVVTGRFASLRSALSACMQMHPPAATRR